MAARTATTTTPAHRYGSLADAAEYAGVSTKTLRRWIAAGLLTGYRAGPKLLRVDLHEVDAMLDRQRIPTGGAAA